MEVICNKNDLTKPIQKVPLKIWATNLDKNCLDQSIVASQLPFAFHHVALMPDGHFGIGVSIGTVFASKDVIVPNFVGVDIGCGMCFFETNIPVSEILPVTTPNGTLLVAILGNIKRNVPTGFNKHREPVGSYPIVQEGIDRMVCPPEEITNAALQLGTLGGGNHFIELQVNEAGNLCFMLHSGSRHAGLSIAKKHDEIAKEMNRKYYSNAPEDIGFLPVDSVEGDNYIDSMNWALDYAQLNRSIMLEKCKTIILNMIEKYTGFRGVKITNEINAHHNYAVQENHYGENVWIHRKGAIRAREGDMGIIPGSCGTASYIVRGRGNPESFHSASHGAGRKMGRKEAERTLSLADVKKSLEGITHINTASKLTDECPLAYKDIEEVIANEADLVDIVMKLKPIAFLKGEGE